MPARNSTTPAVRPSLDLDALEKENPKAPFVVNAGGQAITFGDVRDLPWDELNETVQDPDEFMFKTLSDEDYKHFKALKIPGWKIETLMADYRSHFGIGTRGNGRGSRTS